MKKHVELGGGNSGRELNNLFKKETRILSLKISQSLQLLLLNTLYGNSEFTVPFLRISTAPGYAPNTATKLIYTHIQKLLVQSHKVNRPLYITNCIGTD